MASQYFFGNFSARVPNASISDVNPPTFAGIQSVAANTDGSFTVSWLSASDATPPIEYNIYVALGSVTALTLFQSSNIVTISPASTVSKRIFTLSDQTTYYVNGQIYTFGVRAKDAVGNQDSNLVIATQTAIASGNLPVVYQNIATQLAATESALQTDHTNFQSDHANFAADHSNLQTDHSNLQNDHTNFQGDHTNLVADHGNFVTDHSNFASDHSNFQQDHTNFQSDHTSLLSDHANFQTDHSNFQGDHANLQSDHTGLAAEVVTMTTQNTDFTNNNADFAAENTTLSGLVSALQVAVGSAAGLGGLELEVDDNTSLELEIIDEEEVL